MSAGAAISATSRIAGLDAGRVFAAAAVILNHWFYLSDLTWLRPIGLIAVPFFITIAVLFSTRQVFAGRSVGGLVTAQTRRILVPYLVWTCVYYVLSYVVSGWLIGGHPPWFSAVDAINGFKGNLWFLPLVLMIGMSTAGLASFAARSCARSVAVVMVACTAAAVLLVVTQPGTNNVNRWPYELPVACLAVACAVGIQRGWLRPPRSVWCGLLLLVFAVGLVVWQVRLGTDTDRRACQAAGMLMAAAGFVLPNAAVPSWLARLGRLGFGVYVTHMLLVLTLQRLTGGPGTLAAPALLLGYPVVVVLCFVMTAVLYRLPMTRQVMP